MPEIEITPEQEERLRALQEDIARDVVGKYGHVRPRDAVEYLLDRYEEDEDADPADASGTQTATAGGASDAAPDGAAASSADTDGEGATARVVAGEGGDAADGDASSGGDDAMLNEMMSLLDTHDDKWGESGGDERYEVELPDGTTEQVRTKDDVKALLFKQYR
ncbi:hypothetical protein [Haloplanus litoreus]|uniref:Uncharacterized protein n=2 Tax=Haloplanus litoreus TaxID=767515 RepID=A0ABD5ZZE6_9EURY